MKSIKLIMAACLLVTFVFAFEAPTEDHRMWMKSYGKANGSLKKGGDVAENVAILKSTTDQVENFWKGRGSDVAMKSIADMREGIAELEKAGSDDTAKTAAMQKIGSSCQECHQAHRENAAEKGGVPNIK